MLSRGLQSICRDDPAYARDALPHSFQSNGRSHVTAVTSLRIPARRQTAACNSLRLFKWSFLTMSALSQVGSNLKTVFIRNESCIWRRFQMLPVSWAVLSAWLQGPVVHAGHLETCAQSALVCSDSNATSDRLRFCVASRLDVREFGAWFLLRSECSVHCNQLQSYSFRFCLRLSESQLTLVQDVPASAC